MYIANNLKNRTGFKILVQVCEAGHDVTYERRCSTTCKEKKKKGPLKELIGGIKVGNKKRESEYKMR